MRMRLSVQGAKIRGYYRPEGVDAWAKITGFRIRRVSANK
jgi:hypothetical protein